MTTRDEAFKLFRSRYSNDECMAMINSVIRAAAESGEEYAEINLSDYVYGCDDMKIHTYAAILSDKGFNVSKPYAKSILFVRWVYDKHRPYVVECDDD